MKHLILLLCLVALTGCDSEPLAKTKQDWVCRNDGGVVEYVSWLYDATCRTGVRHNWGLAIVDKEFAIKSKHYKD